MRVNRTILLIAATAVAAAPAAAAGLDKENRPNSVRAGHFKAYRVDIGDTQRIRVVDRRTGDIAVDQPATGDGDGVVRVIVLRRSGSVAWIGQEVREGDHETTFGTLEVHRVNAGSLNTDRRLDRGSGIAPLYLRLSHHGKRIVWQHGGNRSAAIR